MRIREMDEGHYKELVDHLDAGVYFVDRNGLITYWNRAAEEITGLPADVVEGRSCADFILRHVDDQDRDSSESICPLMETLVGGNPRAADLYLFHQAGHRIPVLVRTTPIRSNDGEIVGAVELFVDNSSKAAILEKVKDLEQMALLDPLTRLGNRRCIEMHLSSRMHEYKRYGYPFGVVMMDIDHFKHVNDTYGHDIGDKVLVMVANTIINSSRPSDDFGRWGGEEFIGIFRNVGENSLNAAAERFRMLIRKSVLSFGNESLQITISLGGTLARDADTIESVVKRADKLLYKSKQEGRDRVSID